VREAEQAKEVIIKKLDELPLIGWIVVGELALVLFGAGLYQMSDPTAEAFAGWPAATTIGLLMISWAIIFGVIIAVVTVGLSIARALGFLSHQGRTG